MPPDIPRRLRRAPTVPVPSAVAQRLEASPLQAIDVGAARGVPPHWLPFLHHLRVDAFEPNRKECERLASQSPPNVSWHPTGLAGSEGTRDLHVLATPTGSSFFPPAPDFVELFGIPSYSEVVEVASLPCTTLAAHLDRKATPVVHALKLDTQGSELEILRGLRPEQLAAVQSIEIEVELHEAYLGQPLFPEVHAFLTDAGLSLLDFRVQRAHLTDGVEERHFLKRDLGTAVGTPHLTAQAHAVDALYVRPLRHVAALEDEHEAARAMLILQMYQYYDGLFWLVEHGSWAKSLGEQARIALTEGYRRAAPRPRFLERTGALPHAIRRARRGASFVLEEIAGLTGFDPPRVFWSRAYWPDQ